MQFYLIKVNWTIRRGEGEGGMRDEKRYREYQKAEKGGKGRTGGEERRAFSMPRDIETPRRSTSKAKELEKSCGFLTFSPPRYFAFFNSHLFNSHLWIPLSIFPPRSTICSPHISCLILPTKGDDRTWSN